MKKSDKNLADATDRLADAEKKVVELRDRLEAVQADADLAEVKRQEAGRRGVDDPAALGDVAAAVNAAAVATTLADGLRHAIGQAEAEVVLRKSDLAACEAERDRAKLADLAAARVAAATRLETALADVLAAIEAFDAAGHDIATAGLPLAEGRWNALSWRGAWLAAIPAPLQVRMIRDVPMLPVAPGLAEQQAAAWGADALTTTSAAAAAE